MLEGNPFFIPGISKDSLFHFLALWANPSQEKRMVGYDNIIILFKGMKHGIQATPPKIEEPMALLTVKPVMMARPGLFNHRIIPFCAMGTAMKDKRAGITMVFQVMQRPIYRGRVTLS
jgi:hypothetical protein